MAREVFIEFENVVEHDGVVYAARAVGEERSNGLWDGWIEFHAVGGSGWIPTERETTQPSQQTLKYWATGLTHAYLEGAVKRAVDGPAFSRSWEQSLHGDSPGPRPHVVPQDHTRVAVPGHAVLNPFAVHAEGRGLLRDQLGALHDDQLRNIIRDYGMAEPAEYAHMTDWEMRALILQAVERGAGG